MYMCYSLCLQDMLTTQVSEAALQEQMRKVQADVARSFVAAEVEVDQRMKQFAVLFHTLQEEDDDMKMKIDELENTINKNHGNWQQVAADLSKQVSLRPVSLLTWFSICRPFTTNIQSYFQFRIRRLILVPHLSGIFRFCTHLPAAYRWKKRKQAWCAGCLNCKTDWMRPFKDSLRR